MNKQNVNINPDDMRDAECNKCQCKMFLQTYRIKTLSALMSPTGQDVAMPVPTFICLNCSAELEF